MFLSSWRRLVQQVRRNSKAYRRGKKSPLEVRRSRWLMLEHLEDRTLMSTYVWNGVSGNWNDATNWTRIDGAANTPDVPRLAGDVAMFTGTARITGNPAQLTYTAAQAVTLNANVTVGEIIFATVGGFIPEGGGTPDINSGNVTLSAQRRQRPYAG